MFCSRKSLFLTHLIALEYSLPEHALLFMNYHEENRNQLLSLGWCVWLEVSPEEAWKRVKPYLEQRPLLAQESDPLVKIEKMEEVRNPLYQLAHARFLTDDKDSKKVADDILSLLKKDSLIDFS